MNFCDEKAFFSDIRMYSPGLNEITPAAAATGANSQQFLIERFAPNVETHCSVLRFVYRLIFIKLRKNARPAALFALADPEHLGAAGWAHALGCRPAVFHRNFFGVFHFSLCLAFYTISFHRFPP
jgi:hypothetical protein